MVRAAFRRRRGAHDARCSRFPRAGQACRSATRGRRRRGAAMRALSSARRTRSRTVRQASERCSARSLSSSSCSPRRRSPASPRRGGAGGRAPRGDGAAVAKIATSFLESGLATSAACPRLLHLLAVHLHLLLRLLHLLHRLFQSSPSAANSPCCSSSGERAAGSATEGASEEDATAERTTAETLPQALVPRARAPARAQPASGEFRVLCPQDARSRARSRRRRRTRNGPTTWCSAASADNNRGE